MVQWREHLHSKHEDEVEHVCNPIARARNRWILEVHSLSLVRDPASKTKIKKQSSQERLSHINLSLSYTHMYMKG